MKLLLAGYYGAGNLGDEMMLYCLREWLAAQGAGITVLSACPDQVRRLHGLDAVEDVPLLGEWSWKHAWGRGVAFRLLRAISKHDALAIGGGDLIRDDRGWRPFLTVLEKAVAAWLMGKQLYLLNTGLGTPQTKYGRALLGWVLRRSRRIIVRDQRSVEICAALGASAAAAYAPDIVFRLPALLEKVRLPVEGPYALVCLRGSANVFRRYELTEGRVRAIAAGLDTMVERHGLRIVFLPFQVAAGGDDEKLHHRVALAMRNRDAALVRPWSADLPEIGASFAGCRFVLAMRLHAAVLATAYGKPCVSMPYDHKVVEFAKQFPMAGVAPAEALDDPARFAETLETAANARGPAMPEQAARFWDTERLPLGSAG